MPSAPLEASSLVLGAIVSIGLIVDTALDDLAIFGRAAALLAVGAVLWVVNRLAR